MGIDEMKEINPIVNNMPRSGIRVILDEANKYENVLHLEIGQPNFPTPDHIINAAHQAALEGYTGYTPNAGYDSLRESFSKRIKLDHGINVSSDQVVVAAGAMGALFNAFGTLLSAGDEVLIPDPGYPNYVMALQLLNTKAVPYPLGYTHAGYFIDVDAIRSKITKKTKAIVLNSPSNPTGLVVDKDSIKHILELSSQYGLYVISDEAYDHIIFQGSHISPLQYDDVCENVVAIYSCSKTYAMTGWRIGFVVASSEICQLMAKLQEAYVSCAPSISQKAAEVALEGPQECVEMMNASYMHRRDIAMQLCDDLGIKYVRPNGAFYLMISLPDSVRENSMQFSLNLVRESRLAVAPGITFGAQGEGFIRIALCAGEETITEGLKRLSSVLNKL